MINEQKMTRNLEKILKLLFDFPEQGKNWKILKKQLFAEKIRPGENEIGKLM
jgi:hypothetical protein